MFGSQQSNTKFIVPKLESKWKGSTTQPNWNTYDEKNVHVNFRWGYKIRQRTTYINASMIFSEKKNGIEQNEMNGIRNIVLIQSTVCFANFQKFSVSLQFYCLMWIFSPKKNIHTSSNPLNHFHAHLRSFSFSIDCVGRLSAVELTAILFGLI